MPPHMKVKVKQAVILRHFSRIAEIPRELGITSVVSYLWPINSLAVTVYRFEEVRKGSLSNKYVIYSIFHFFYILYLSSSMLQ